MPRADIPPVTAPSRPERSPSSFTTIGLTLLKIMLGGKKAASESRTADQGFELAA